MWHSPRAANSPRRATDDGVVADGVVDDVRRHDEVLREDGLEESDLLNSCHADRVPRERRVPVELLLGVDDDEERGLGAIWHRKRSEDVRRHDPLVRRLDVVPAHIAAQIAAHRPSRATYYGQIAT